ncbi:MAG TPA: GH3 auxin-responsive promoter family protein [Polyangiaceae bacterium LLY-WYZ-15_(1-7)]|nr:autotransporter [Myxococcales bacterium]MAT26596.1 autotransporter [Sandaracinus sp.]HJL01866.1 GH3 auxin-responsive promoter family protein [Polyangiaceae bacterium LLY-WYZ-15_(1-7)]MBJ72462.1 autotransporter [Sandaracinus sp.]HJL12977.1 GH3 auxin-responsive promoter family protein [Polyangiaceae bacterium LLY-WYZ-15_(1-7)]
MAPTDRALLTALGLGWTASLAPAWRRFARAARDPERAQLELLKRLVRENASTAYGQAHRFEDVRDLASWQRRVPIVRHEALVPWIARVAAGEMRVLTSEPVRMLERTGGSTDANKLVPYTAGLLADFAAATGPWLFDLHRRHPGLLGTRSYWSVSPVAREPERTEGGLPIGLEDDTAYFGPLERFALGRMMAVPGRLARMRDVDAWRFETARRLLAADDLGLISVWSPTFLTLLMEHVEARLGDLLACLPEKRAARIEAAVQAEGRVTGAALWPRLAVVSCWADGPSEQAMPALRRFFPKTAIQPKGLLATEGVVSFPLCRGAGDGRGGDGRGGAVAAATSHFLELIDLSRPDAPPVLLHEAEVGGRYSPVLSTRGGFYRYHLPDVVEVTGRHGALPRLRFVEKLERVSDRFGEKIHAAQVRAGLERATAKTGIVPRFALLAPSDDAPPRYRLYLEAVGDGAACARFGRALEAQLEESHHYAYCRRLGQLAPLEVRRVKDGAATYLRVQQARGQRAGDVKLTCLDPRGGWDAAFPPAGEAAAARVRP